MATIEAQQPVDLDLSFLLAEAAALVQVLQGSQFPAEVVEMAYKEFNKDLYHGPDGPARRRPAPIVEQEVPTVVDPMHFAAYVCDIVRSEYCAKTEFFNMTDYVTSDERLAAGESRLRRVAHNFINPFVLTLEGNIIDHDLLDRRDQFRSTITELALPSLCVVSYELPKR